MWNVTIKAVPTLLRKANISIKCKNHVSPREKRIFEKLRQTLRVGISASVLCGLGNVDTKGKFIQGAGLVEWEALMNITNTEMHEL